MLIVKHLPMKQAILYLLLSMVMIAPAWAESWVGVSTS